MFKENELASSLLLLQKKTIFCGTETITVLSYGLKSFVAPNKDSVDGLKLCAVNCCIIQWLYIIFLKNLRLKSHDINTTHYLFQMWLLNFSPINAVMMSESPLLLCFVVVNTPLSHLNQPRNTTANIRCE